MKHIQETSRSQTLLLPACVDDYVGLDNVVRFVEAFVNSLDLATPGFEWTLLKTTGRALLHRSVERHASPFPKRT